MWHTNWMQEAPSDRFSDMPEGRSRYLLIYNFSLSLIVVLSFTTVKIPSSTENNLSHSILSVHKIARKMGTESSPNPIITLYEPAAATTAYVEYVG
jgi:hypothetical protein